MKNIVLFVLILACFIGSDAEAQRRRFGRYSLVDGFSITAKGGMNIAMVELNEKNTSWVTGIAINKGISEFFNVRLELETGVLKGQKVDYYNSRFRTDFYQINLMPILNLGRIIFDESPVNLGVYAGIGTIRFNAAAYDIPTGRLQRVTSDDYSRHTTTFVKVGTGQGDDGIYYTKERTIPMGILLSMPLGESLNVGLDFRYNWVRTDKLDATSGLDTSAMYNNNGINLLWGNKTYSDTPNDKWSSVSVTLTYKFASQFSKFQRGV
ncbi:MAG: hypothetical protein U0Y10_03800 [Spirosomataceae bacterium]